MLDRMLVTGKCIAKPFSKWEYFLDYKHYLSLSIVIQLLINYSSVGLHLPWRLLLIKINSRYWIELGLE